MLCYSEKKHYLGRKYENRSINSSYNHYCAPPSQVFLSCHLMSLIVLCRPGRPQTPSRHLQTPTDCLQQTPHNWTGLLSVNQHCISKNRDGELTLRRSVRRLGQRSAQVNIHHNALILKVASDITARVREICQRRAPGAGIRCCSRRCPFSPYGWQRHETLVLALSPPKHPRADPLVSPLERYDPAPGGVELGPVGGRRAGDGAARVVVDLVVAVALAGRARHPALYVLHGAASGGVECYGIASVGVVDSFHNVDLAVGRPVVWTRWSGVLG